MVADGDVVKEKKYTEDHEWIEMSADGKTCMSTLPAFAHAQICFSSCA